MFSVPNMNARRLTKQTPEILEFVDRAMERNDETTSTDLVKMVAETFDVKISEATMKRVRRKLE